MELDYFVTKREWISQQKRGRRTFCQKEEEERDQ